MEIDILLILLYLDIKISSMDYIEDIGRFMMMKMILHIIL